MVVLLSLSYTSLLCIVIMMHNSKDQLIAQRHHLRQEYGNANQRIRGLKKDKSTLLPIDEVNVVYD